MKTKIIKIESVDDSRDAIQQAAAVLSQGGLVGFPTETVYGLAARVDRPGALERLCTLKDRPGDKPFTLHIGSKKEIDRFAPDLSLLDRSFLRKAWPGPLTVVFELNESQQKKIRASVPADLAEKLYYKNSIGVRLPDDAVARALLENVDGPVVAPSANLAGQNPPTDAQEVLESLDGQIELVLDSGPTRYRKASTIVRIGRRNHLEIIRLGVLDEGAVRRKRSLKVLFVCTGNSCRSPMAEGLFRKHLAGKLGCRVDQLEEMGYKVESAGTMAYEGQPASAEAIVACNEAGIDIRKHRSQRMSLTVVQNADCVFVMSGLHLSFVREISPGLMGRTALLAGDHDIADPIGQSKNVYRQCAKEIECCVHDWIDHKLDRWDWPLYS